MAEILASNALVDVATILSELGLTGNAFNDVIIRRINQASNAIETYINRRSWPLVFGFRQQQFSVSGARRSPRVRLRALPIAAAARIDLLIGNNTPPTPLNNGTDWWLEDPVKGWLYYAARFIPTNLRAFGITQDWDMNTQEAINLATYCGGYLTAPMLATITGIIGWPGAGATVQLGALINPASQPTQYWLAGGFVNVTLAGVAVVGPSSGVTGATDPFASVSAPTIGQQVTDGQVVWTYQGVLANLLDSGRSTPVFQNTWTTATPVALASPLPADIRGAAIATVVTLYRRKGDSTDIMSEKIGDASYTYGQRGMLPPEAADALADYVRVGMA
jgi:hypothetical protein